MYKHIMIPTDGSEISRRAVDEALKLASKLEARVTILVATERWSALDMAEQARRGMNNPVEEYERIARRHAEELLAKMAEKATAAKVSFETVYAAEKHPAEAIVANAAARGCDLIVMGSHGRRGVDRLLLGSQTAKVLAMTHLPVLVYH